MQALACVHRMRLPRSLLISWAFTCARAQPIAPGFAKRVVLLGVDGIAPTLEGSPTLQRLLAEGAGTLNARANLPSVTVPNWAAVLTGAGPSELSISTNSWTRETARSPPVSFDLIQSCARPYGPSHCTFASPTHFFIQT
eukprot:COSAG03_NODE_4748_length_1445_cov_2.664190_2_plen_140_part_00